MSALCWVYDKNISDMRLLISNSSRAVLTYIGTDNDMRHRLDVKVMQLENDYEVRRLIAEFQDRALIHKPDSTMKKYFPNYAQEFIKT